jgi:hypothetical protein
LATRVLLALVIAGGCALASLAIADGFDSETPATIVVGAPRGYAPTERLGPERRGQSKSALPKSPRKLWSRELSGGLELPPVVDHQGGVVAALSSPDLVRLSGGDGRQTWRTRLGLSSTVAGPVIASDGSIVLVTGEGALWSVAPGGGVRFSVPLDVRTSDVEVTPLALDDGSVVVAGEHSLVHVDASGGIMARAELKVRPAGGLIGYERGVLATGADGEVVFWRAPGPARKLGSFGGRLDGGAVLMGARTLVAVVDRMSVVALDLKTGNTSLLTGGGEAIDQLEGPPSLGARGLLLLTNVIGELIGIDAHGVVVKRMPLETLPMVFGADAGGTLPPMFRRLEARSSPPLVTDPRGRIAFVRSSGKLGVVDESGNVVTVSPRVCARPLSVLPAGEGRIMVACRSGSVSVHGDGT